jgi:hypothetical protein
MVCLRNISVDTLHKGDTDDDDDDNNNNKLGLLCLLYNVVPHLRPSMMSDGYLPRFVPQYSWSAVLLWRS